MFNRMDIAAAYYLYAYLNHGGQFSKEYAIFGTLDKIEYKPWIFLDTPENLNENARGIYEDLVANPDKLRDRR